MAIVSTPQTIRLTGSLTIEPAIPIVGGTESAVAINEVSSLKAVSQIVLTIPASDTEIINFGAILNSDFGFIMVQSTDTVSISSGTMAARGDFIVIKPTSNTFSSNLTITNPSSTSTVTVRLTIGAYS
jgi:hypothetical protein